MGLRLWQQGVAPWFVLHVSYRAFSPHALQLAASFRGHGCPCLPLSLCFPVDCDLTHIHKMAETLTLRATLKAHAGWVTAIATPLDPTSNVLLSASR